MDSIDKAMHNLAAAQQEAEQTAAVPFADFLVLLRERPYPLVRNVFQIFHDMVKSYVGEGLDEYPDDPESIQFLGYDFAPLLVAGTDQPFFTDRIFANRLMNLADSFRSGAQQNKIYIFDGPPGCGKSTFLNNLLLRFEEYCNSDPGRRMEVVWRLDRRSLGSRTTSESNPVIEKLAKLLDPVPAAEDGVETFAADPAPDELYVEVPCPSHDNPLLMIPKERRREFLDDLFENDEFKWNLSYGKEYDWVFRDNPCTICSALYEALLSRLGNPYEVFQMLYARPYRFNRRLGSGITVFNPGDKPSRHNVLTNQMLQKRINALLRDSNQVKYVFSQYAKTNDGIYALQDIKGHNKDRLLDLHNIISEGVHKVDDIEENVSSLFLGVMNPEDNRNLRGLQSLSDRIEFVSIPYVLEYNTEVQIYRNIFGRYIDERFLPRVLENFARVIISTRLNKKSPAMLEWIAKPEKYKLYCDENLHLLKMAIYAGVIPTWLSEADVKGFTAKRRREIIAEAENEGDKGFSGRDSINIFHDLFFGYARGDSHIDMDALCQFFTQHRPDLGKQIPDGFLDSLRRMYNYSILQEVKESLFYFNDEQISRDLQNYLFALNYEIGSVERCTFTGDRVEISENFLNGIENRLLGAGMERGRRLLFREETQREYTSRTLTQEILLEGKPITETDLYDALHERYVFHVKEKVLEPFLDNANFRRAIKDYDRDAFHTYDQRIRNDVTYLITNLCDKYGYNEQGAQEVCIYVIDNELAKEFADQ
jgi:predicted Ser/Thr protein kinase